MFVGDYIGSFELEPLPQLTACFGRPQEDFAMPVKTMQAVICHGPEDYRLEERPVPSPGRARS